MAISVLWYSFWRFAPNLPNSLQHNIIRNAYKGGTKCFIITRTKFSDNHEIAKIRVPAYNINNKVQSNCNSGRKIVATECAYLASNGWTLTVTSLYLAICSGPSTSCTEEKTFWEWGRVALDCVCVFFCLHCSSDWENACMQGGLAETSIHYYNFVQETEKLVEVWPSCNNK